MAEPQSRRGEDVGLYDYEQQGQRSSVIRTGHTGQRSRPSQNSRQTHPDDIIAEYSSGDDELTFYDPITYTAQFAKTQRTNGGTKEHMRITTRTVQPTARTVQPTTRSSMTRATTQAQPLPRQKTYRPQYIPQTEPEYEYEPQLNRQQRRAVQGQLKARGKMMTIAGYILFGGIILYIGGSIVSGLWVTNVSDPMTYGPAHGNIVEMTDGKQHATLYGINDHGHTEIVEISRNPTHMQIIQGADTETTVEVELKVVDFNHDGHPDIQMDLYNGTSALFFPRQPKTYFFVNDGHGNFKIQDQQQ